MPFDRLNDMSSKKGTFYGSTQMVPKLLPLVVIDIVVTHPLFSKLLEISLFYMFEKDEMSNLSKAITT
jgi:hypothetical protein